MRGRPMAKIKLLICLLLACGMANAGVTLSVHGKRHPFDVKTRWLIGDAEQVITNLPNGWKKCVADASRSVINVDFFGTLTCHTTEGRLVSVVCKASERKNEDYAQVHLETSDKFDEKTYGTAKVSRWVMIKCTYP